MRFPKNLACPVCFYDGPWFAEDYLSRSQGCKAAPGIRFLDCNTPGRFIESLRSRALGICGVVDSRGNSYFEGKEAKQKGAKQ